MCEPGSSGASNSGGGTSPNESIDGGNNNVGNVESSQEEQQQQEEKQIKGRWKFRLFVLVLFLDLVCSIIFLTQLIPSVDHYEGTSSNDIHHPRGWFKGFSVSESVIDLSAMAVIRIFFAFVGLYSSYLFGMVRPEYYPLELHHRTGIKKTREELEEEALDLSMGTWFKLYLFRPSFLCELAALVSSLWCVLKCLIRLNVELGIYHDKQPLHPLLWVAVTISALAAVLESFYIDSVCQIVAHRGKKITRPRVLERISSSLSVPLLSRQASNDENADVNGDTDEEQPADNASNNPNNDDAVGVSEISSDTDYKASWKDLAAICKPDFFYIVLAFIFLLLAAAAQVYIPRFTGNILDALAEYFAHSNTDDDNTDDGHGDESITSVPGFVKNVKGLIIASILGGVFSGIRGSIFTFVGGRVNVRLRLQLMDALLVQDIGFFDCTKTGYITSRLSSDTSLVGDQVTLNVNVFLRSLVQAIGVLVFMFVISWQLTVLAFISVPAITIFSRWYGNFVRSLIKVMQKKLADGNAVSEACMSSMPTVRAFDAAIFELSEFEKHMKKYLSLNLKSAIAYSGYSCVATALPQLVTALVVFYGGLMVRNETMKSGELVSFLLYLQSLSDAFSSIGYIFSALTQAVGAADKVFELMHRKPKLKAPSSSAPSATTTNNGQQELRLLNVATRKTTIHRETGLRPETCNGEITLEGVEMRYPARPQRQILNGMSLHIPPGKIAALVGPSGGGKSSVISLVQHLYEHSSGKVLLDGQEVHEFCPKWLYNHVSIVSQEPTLFARSVKNNIIYGLEGENEPSREEIEKAAKLANAHDFIMKLPLKYDTEVGERGVQLSGGQKQRIAIARALVRKPKILLLDEATSALDAESEHMVQEAIDQMLASGRGSNGDAGMTVLIVAHRLSTIRSADIIFVVQNGQIVEEGSHSELVDKPDGAYSALIRRQMDVQKKLEGET